MFKGLNVKETTQVKSCLCIDMTFMCVTLAFIYVETSLSTCIKSIDAFTSITSISVFACGIWIAYIFKRFTKKDIFKSLVAEFTIRLYLYSHINHAHCLHNRHCMYIYRILRGRNHHNVDEKLLTPTPPSLFSHDASELHRSIWNPFASLAHSLMSKQVPCW